MAINKIILFGAILAVGNAGVIAVAPFQYSAAPTQFSAAAFHHSASLGPYSDATSQYLANSDENPSEHIQYSAAPTHYPAAAVHHSVTPVQNPVRYTTAPTQYSANPVQYSSAPVQYSMVPTQYPAAAAHHSAAPVQYSAAPFQHPTTTNGFSGVQAQYSTGSSAMVKGVSPVHYPQAPAVAKEEEDYDPNPQYTYGYDVQDGQTGDSKNHNEQRQGDAVQGSYSLVDPDGYRRTVEYTADSVHGFNAVVRREPLQGAHVAKVAAPGYVSASAPSYHH